MEKEKQTTLRVSVRLRDWLDNQAIRGSETFEEIIWRLLNLNKKRTEVKK